MANAPLKTDATSSALRAPMLLLTAVVSLDAAPVSAEPTLEETISFARTELANLCGDPEHSGIDALDRLMVNGRRSCDVVLTAGRLSMQVRERGSEDTSRSFARLTLDVRFNKETGFICGRTGQDGMAPLFFTCEAAKGANGPICAERSVEVDDQTRDPFASTQTLAAASILRVDPKNCGIVARALSFIGERSKAAPKSNVREYFSTR